MLSAGGLLYQLPDQLSSSCEGSVRRKSLAIAEHYISYSGGKRRFSDLYFVSSHTLGFALDSVEFTILLPLLVLVTHLLLILFYSGFACELLFSVSLCPTEQCICTLT